jgi:hypothetical protein
MLYRVGIPTTQRTLRKTKGVYGFVVSRYIIAHEWLHSEALRVELSIIQISTCHGIRRLHDTICF